ncbi:MAG: hypothetical protein GVY18_07670 [Bacteroidetes bacterium]|nr:hypothetical protein [Bacteroidota bacterium]
MLRICYRSRWAPYVEVYSPEQMPIAGDPAWERYYHLAFCCCRFGHGIAAGYLVHKLREQGPSDAAAERAQREEKQEALRAVARAHEAWRAVRREQGQEHAEERRRAAARRDAYLDRMLGLGEREAKERRNGARCQELLKELNG